MMAEKILLSRSHSIIEEIYENGGSVRIVI